MKTQITEKVTADEIDINFPLKRGRKPARQPFVLAFLLCLSTLLLFCSDDDDDDLEDILALIQSGNYSDNNNGTVNDNGSNLMWAKCSVGQSYSPELNDCSASGGGTTFNAISVHYCETEGLCSDPLTAVSGPAFNACANFSIAGHEDWRLPDRFELGGLANNFSHTGFHLMFPQTPDDKYYWSSTAKEDDNKLAIGFTFEENNYGNDASFIKHRAYNYVRCVRER